MTFSHSSGDPFCLPETGGRAKRRGYDKRWKTENNIPPPELRSSVQRRTGECSPQRVQNDIQSFFWRPSSPPILEGQRKTPSPTFSPWDRGSTRRGRGYDINGNVKTQNEKLLGHTPSALRARHPYLRGTKETENGNLRVSESRSIVVTRQPCPKNESKTYIIIIAVNAKPLFFKFFLPIKSKFILNIFYTKKFK